MRLVQDFHTPKWVWKSKFVRHVMLFYASWQGGRQHRASLRWKEVVGDVNLVVLVVQSNQKYWGNVGQWEVWEGYGYQLLLGVEVVVVMDQGKKNVGFEVKIENQKKFHELWLIHLEGIQRCDGNVGLHMLLLQRLDLHTTVLPFFLLCICCLCTCSSSCNHILKFTSFTLQGFQYGLKHSIFCYYDSIKAKFKHSEFRSLCLLVYRSFYFQNYKFSLINVFEYIILDKKLLALLEAFVYYKIYKYVCKTQNKSLKDFIRHK